MSKLPPIQKKESKIDNKAKILGLLVIVLVWRGAAFFMAPDESRAGTNKSKITSTAPANNQPHTAELSQLTPLTINWSFNFDRDPFDKKHIIPPPKPKITKVDKPDVPETPDAEKRYAQLLKLLKVDIKLSGTVAGAKPRAVINGQLYNLNDTVKGFKITSIKQRQIKLTRENFEFLIKM